MKFIEFLESAKNKNFWEKSNLLCFRGNDYNILFYSYLFNSLIEQQISETKPTNLSYDLEETATLISTLSQSFLGECVVYWLSEVEIKTDKKNLAFQSLISNYEGPNKIIFFIKNDKTLSTLPAFKNCTVVELESDVDQKLFMKIVSFFKKERIEQKQVLIKKIFEVSQTINLETCCMLIEYLDLISVNNLDQFIKFIPKIIEPKESLHNLSKNFFSKNVDNFFSCWNRINSDFPHIFWITFWSEQLWQAINAINYLESNQFNNAKKIGYRLPFIFFNQLWKQCKKDELRSAHNFLYLSDHAFKLGSSFPSIELFYAKYFNNEFK